jgi:hypothetical protein
VLGGFATHGGGLERQDDAELREQTAYTVEGGRAGFDESLPSAVNHQALLLLAALDRHEQHVRTGHGFADCSRVGRVVLGTAPSQPIRRNELRCHQAHGVAVGGKQPCPMMCTRAGFHADRARRQSRHQLHQLGPRNARVLHFGFAGIAHAVHGKHVLGEINTNGQNSHGLPLPNMLMRVRTSHRGT